MAEPSLRTLLRPFKAPCLLPRRKRTLWTQPYMVAPALVKAKFGNGKRLIALLPILHRPRYYLVWIDDQWDLENGDDWLDQLDTIWQAIGDEFGSRPPGGHEALPLAGGGLCGRMLLGRSECRGCAAETNVASVSSPYFHNADMSKPFPGVDIDAVHKDQPMSDEVTREQMEQAWNAEDMPLLKDGITDAEMWATINQLVRAAFDRGFLAARKRPPYVQGEAKEMQEALRICLRYAQGSFRDDVMSGAAVPEGSAVGVVRSALNKSIGAGQAGARISSRS